MKPTLPQQIARNLRSQMDLSAAQHQLHHRYLNHHHHQVHHQQQQQEMDSESLDSIIARSKQGAAAAAASAASAAAGQEKSPKPKPADNEAQKCPRCDSTNTKFCYYNNYSLSQPRYFCKACRRYWTKGGTLRNVPVGGGCRKSNKRPSSPSSLLIKRPHSHDVITTSSFATAPHSAPPSSNNPALFYGGSSSRGSFDHHHALQLQLQGNATLTDCDGLLPNPHAFTFLDSLRHNGGLFQSLGYGAGDAGSVVADDVAGGGGGSHAATAVANVKQENDGRALWGFPWQVNYGEMGAADVEPIRGSWNGLIGNSAWQGLLNSPAALM